MHNETEHTDPLLRKFFNQQPEVHLPLEFENKLMKQILREQAHRQRRNLWWTWCGIGIVSGFLVAIAIFIFNYLSIDLLHYFKDIFHIPQFQSTPNLLYVFVGGSALVLLIIDNYLRKFFLK